MFWNFTGAFTSYYWKFSEFRVGFQVNVAQDRLHVAIDCAGHAYPEWPRATVENRQRQLTCRRVGSVVLFGCQWKSMATAEITVLLPLLKFGLKLFHRAWYVKKPYLLFLCCVYTLFQKHMTRWFDQIRLEITATTAILGTVKKIRDR